MKIKLIDNVSNLGSYASDGAKVRNGQVVIGTREGFDSPWTKNADGTPKRYRAEDQLVVCCSNCGDYSRIPLRSLRSAIARWLAR